MTQSYHISKPGFEKLLEEFRVLQEEKLPVILDAVSRARAHGDLRENGEYHAARQEQRTVNDRLDYLSVLIKQARIVEPSEKEKEGVKIVRFGSKVKIEDEKGAVKEFTIVGEYESDVERKMLSINSPLARSCIGKEMCEIIYCKTPTGEREYEIIEISSGLW